MFRGAESLRHPPQNSVENFLSNELKRELEIARKTILDIAERYLDYPAVKYHSKTSGQSPESGFDCSGFILFVLMQAQEKLPHLFIPPGIRHANEFYDSFGVHVHNALTKPGDLVFETREGFSITHVGFLYHKDERGNRWMLHSPGKTGEQVSIKKIIPSALSPVRAAQLYDRNPVGCRRPTLQTSHDRWKQIPIK